MKIEKGKILVDLEKKPIKNEDETEVTLEQVIVQSLLVPSREDTGEEKYKKFKIAQFVTNPSSTSIDLTPEEASLVKKCVGSMYAPLIVGQVWDILNG